ncbi:MAG TPA: CRTAC1 family protein, partial [Verrucomicrobiales bacterium]|nr:CRTAC1 family protein [Verrucomicrobiales bacterium]
MAQPDPIGEPDEQQTLRALWRAALMLLIVVAAVLGVFFWQAHRQGSIAGLDAVGSGVGQERELSAVPGVGFTDITEEAGVLFIHQNGASGEKLLPETMGSGVAFFDMDGDGDADLLFVNGARSGWALPPHDENGGPLTLCRNDTLPGGAPRFVDITGDSGLSGPLRGMGVAVGDHDGDGLTDVYVTAVGGNRLYRNLGSGRFVDVTQPSGTAGGNEDWSTSAAFLDYDRDGDLDLFVCNYVRWSRELDLRIDYQLAGVGRAYGPPLNFPGTVPFLFRNEGNGRFTEVAGQAGLHVRSRSSGEPLAKSLGVVPVDLDQDGWLDLVVANDTVQNFVFRNLGNGTFREIGAASGLALDAFGGTRGAMGID